MFYEQSKKLLDRSQPPPGLTPALVRARLIGRQPSGRVLGAKKSDRGTLNDFDFKEDPKGLVCPFYAHTRKMNPRAGMREDWNPRERRVLRRGIPYGPAIKRDASGAPDEGVVKYVNRDDVNILAVPRDFA